MDQVPKTQPVKPWTFDDYPTSYIRRAAATGIYDIRGGGSKRRVPHFDDLLFLGASVSRYPLEGYREACGTNVTLGTRFAKNPIELDIPITIAGMSFGALSGPAKEALGRGASAAGTSTTTGDEASSLSKSRSLRFGRCSNDMRSASTQVSSLTTATGLSRRSSSACRHCSVSGRSSQAEALLPSKRAARRC